MTAPFFDHTFTFSQPDGTTLEVRGWGDEHHAVFRTLDGFTVVRDPHSGFWEYAAAGPDAQSLHATGMRPGTVPLEALALEPGLRLDRSVSRALAEIGTGLPRQHWRVRRERRRAVLRSLALAAEQGPAEVIAPAPPSRATVGDYVGLCLLIDFPDVPATIGRDEVDAFCNQRGYSGFGNNGSVHDYFLDNSLGRMRYTTVVAPWYTAKQRRAYYTDPAIPYGERARELIREALAHHVAQGLDTATLTLDVDDNVYATNVFYAGSSVNGWAQGLWPHASRLLTPFDLGTGGFTFDYQITSMGTRLTLGTYCHENGHMLCEFPDLYDYGPESSGVGNFCLMCMGGNVDPRNPTQVCGYLKRLAGWAGTVTAAARGLQVQLSAANNDLLLHRHTPWEYFLVENRRRTGRDAALPDEGVAIWHVDELGDNSLEQGTLAQHYECSLIQADGRRDLEQGIGTGDANDLYHAGWRDRFGPGTVPSSTWWDGQPSALDIRAIGPAGDVVELQVAEA